MLNIGDEYNFDGIYKMTPYELEKLDIEVLVKHIIKLKKCTSKSNKIRCSCGEKIIIKNLQNIKYDNCERCKRCICSRDVCRTLCEDCCCYYCENCIEVCKFCGNRLCKNCVENMYPEWNLSGCTNMVSAHFLGNKANPIKKRCSVITHHCIFSIATTDNKTNQTYTLCNTNSYFGNICEDHFDSTYELIYNNINTLPKDLIKMCIDYYFVKINNDNWNTIEHKNFRNVSIENYELMRKKNKDTEFDINNKYYYCESSDTSDSDNDYTNDSHYLDE